MSNTAQATAASPLPMSGEMGASSHVFADIFFNNIGERVTVGSIVDRLDERAFWILLLLTALPNLVPTPLFISALFGIPMALLAAQMVLGHAHPWLPDWLRRKTIRSARLEAFGRRAMPVLAKVEKLCRQRWPGVAAPMAHRLLAVLVLVCGLMIAVPLPMTNMIPGYGTALIAIGALEGDGRLMIIGAVVGKIGLIVGTFAMLAVAGLSVLAVGAVV